MNSSPTELFLSRLHWPVTTLGYGRRIGIWFQGCSIRCKECCSLDTWIAEPAHATTVEEVLAWIEIQPLEQVDGFTISGGEPFDQPVALMRLLQALNSLRVAASRSKDILVYSGFAWRTLRQRHALVLESIDTLVSEPYVRTRPTDGLSGSANQVVRCLTEIGRLRHGAVAASGGPARIQMHFDGHRLWMIGIPQRGALDVLQERLAASGIALSDCSWRA